jgi:hypothetical protein
MNATYENDFFAWTQHQAELLRAGRFHEMDVEHLIEEVVSLGERDKREVRSRLILVLMHLLKWQYQPSHRSSSWRGTINEQRSELSLLFEDSPSLRRVATEHFERCYVLARKRAADETGLSLNIFPERSPWPLEQSLTLGFLPDSPI